MAELGALLNGFRWADGGANNVAIEAATRKVGELPNDYLAVMQSHDGGEGFIGDGAYLRLWPIGDLQERNRTLEAEQLIPGVVLIGTDGADDLYAIELATAAYLIFPAVGLSADAGEKVAESWDGFLQALSTR